ncbi:MAG: CNNM domain-containing protein [Alphaproteobacteria bacterium]|nr:CNNM domain-containing protein [Alphaproteobacteria bacterium]
MSLLIISVALTVGLSFLCSLMEAALLSTTPSYIAGLEQKRPNVYRKMSNLKAHVDTPLAAILMLNTVANTAGASCIGAQVANLYGNNYVAIASGVMTVLILLCSEIIPKTIGATYWKKLIGFLCFILPLMIFVLKPFLFIFEKLTNALKPKTNSDQADLREEILALTKMGYVAHCINSDEYNVINNTMNLDSIKIKDVLTPRNVCETVVSGMKASEFSEFVKEKSFSRYPVQKNEDEETFIGYVHKSDFVDKDDNEVVDSVIRSVLEIASTANASTVFADMMKNHTHIGVVYDEVGTWLGIVTMEDILESVLGKEIVDETDKIVDMRTYAKTQWQFKKAEQMKKKDVKVEYVSETKNET